MPLSSFRGCSLITFNSLLVLLCSDSSFIGPLREDSSFFLLLVCMAFLSSVSQWRLTHAKGYVSLVCLVGSLWVSTRKMTDLVSSRQRGKVLFVQWVFVVHPLLVNVSLWVLLEEGWGGPTGSGHFHWKYLPTFVLLPAHSGLSQSSM